MRFGTIVFVMACLALSTVGHAQPRESRLAVRFGFALGNDFLVPDGAGGVRVTHLEGFEVGADALLTKNVRGLSGIYFSPTVTFGGSNRKGADTDGTIYHLMVNAKRALGDRGLYVGLGIGYSWTSAKIGEFSDVSGFASQYLVGYTLDRASIGRSRPFVEIGYFDSTDNKMRGWSFDVGLRL